MRLLSFLAMHLLLAGGGGIAALPAQGVILEEAAVDVLSPTFRACFLDKDAPLNAEAYPCLDQEYHRLDAVLTQEYRAALARLADNAGRQRLQQNERLWWRKRFRHCKDEVGDLRGSTATVINENCEIDAVARRIAWLRHYGPKLPGAVKLEDMAYDEARAVILGHGWKAFPDKCGGPPVDAATCARYPELGYCQGTGRGQCGMKFTKADRCLFLSTVESPPGGGYTVITEAIVAHGPCSKELDPDS